MTFLWCRENTPLARCTYEGTGTQIHLVEYKVLDSTVDVIWQMIPMPVDDVTLYQALANRVMPSCRFNPSKVGRYGTAVYNPEVMCRATHGANPQGPFWMNYEDDPPGMRYEDVAVQ